MKYIVVKMGWEYDDQYYSINEGESYNISSKLFSNKEEADKECDKSNINFITKDWRGNECDPSNFIFGRYSYDLEDNIEFYDWLVSIGGCTEEFCLPSGATDEMVLKALELSGITFYKVIEIEE